MPAPVAPGWSGRQAAPAPAAKAPPPHASRGGRAFLAPACIRTDPSWEAFQQGLRDLGYVEGQNMHIECRCGDFRDEQLLAVAGELVRLPVDVLVTAGAGAVAAKQATTTIPIVFAVF